MDDKDKGLDKSLSDMFKSKPDTSKETKPGYQDVGKGSTTSVLDQDKDKNLTKEEQRFKDSSDPYQNFQDVDASKERAGELADELVKKLNATREERLRRENMSAKEAEIAKSGTFTPEEAAKIKQGLDPAKQAEVDAQTIANATKEDAEQIEKSFNDINNAIQAYLTIKSIGLNEKRARLRQLRQSITELEIRMDRGFI